MHFTVQTFLLNDKCSQHNIGLIICDKLIIVTFILMLVYRLFSIKTGPTRDNRGTSH
jgi:hypothetical protein